VREFLPAELTFEKLGYTNLFYKTLFAQFHPAGFLQDMFEAVKKTVPVRRPTDSTRISASCTKESLQQNRRGYAKRLSYRNGLTCWMNCA
jgi:hypothetical protein